MRTIRQAGSDTSAAFFQSLEKRRAPISNHWKSLLSALVLLAGPCAHAAEDIGPLVFSAATTCQTGGVYWSYVVWHATDHDLLRGKVFEVFRKEGDAGSANVFASRGMIFEQTDPNVIRMLCNRAVNLGEDLAKLDDSVTAMFGGLLPSNSLPLTEKISVVIRGAAATPEDRENLAFLARRHPALALCLGRAHAEQLGPAGTTATYELRDLSATRTDQGLISRLTVSATNAPPLPLPLNVQAVPETTPKGDLNIRLRWRASDELMRRALLHFGYNVYRVKESFAVARGYHTAPPATTNLLSYLVDSPTGNVVRINRAPVLTDDEAATNDWFIADDGGRYDSPQGASVFTNGARFYYFVTARDLLGRDGLVSTGVLATVCDRMPPPPPAHPRLVPYRLFTNSAARRGLTLQWEAPPAFTNESITSYNVYRSQDFRAISLSNLTPIAGPIAHVATQAVYRITDTNFTTADIGKAFWYVVRAVDAGACGGNLSARSLPVSGVLYDWVPPATPSGTVSIVCRKLYVTNVLITTDTLTDFDPTGTAVRIVTAWPATSGGDAGADWVSVRWGDSEKNYLTGVLYRAMSGTNSSAPLVWTNSGSFQVCLQAGTLDGRTSLATCVTITNPPPTGMCYRVTTHVDVRFERVLAGDDCQVHEASVTAADGFENPVEVTVILPTSHGGKELRLFRRYNGGALALIGQVTNLLGAFVTLADDLHGGARGGEVCYYAQLLDENGNPGSLSLITCIRTAPILPLPKPVISRLAPLGSESSPRMRVQWSCPPPGVRHFELWLGTQDRPPSKPAANLSSNLIGDSYTGDLRIFGELWKGCYRSPTPGTQGFGAVTGGLFQVDLSIVSGVDYFVAVRAVGEAGRAGPMSDERQFVWRVSETNPAPPDAGPMVPWPAREHPPTILATSFHPRLAPVFLDKSVYSNKLAQSVPALRIGEVSSKLTFRIPFVIDSCPTCRVERFLYRNQRPPGNSTNTVLPCVLYRMQLTNAVAPHVSGDTIQVSPLVENIAVIWSDSDTVVVDPFITILPQPGNNAESYDIFLLDTQPVIRGARYLYLLARFKPDGEMDEILYFNTSLTIP